MTENKINIEESDIERLIGVMEELYDFVVNSYDSYSIARDYGNGEKMNMVQIHTLSFIADNPGVTVSEVAAMWRRTLSAASQNVTKLLSKGLIEKRKEDGNDKIVHLYATDEGMKLSEKHKEYDRLQMKTAAEKLLSRHTREELETAYAVFETSREACAEYESADIRY